MERANAANMICILQINMQRSAIGYELLAQLSTEVKDDLMVIKEQYRDKGPA